MLLIDRFPFDGTGYTLAHAYYPYDYQQYGGDIHFDSDEKWSYDGVDHQDGRTDFFSVAVRFTVCITGL